MKHRISITKLTKDIVLAILEKMDNQNQEAEVPVKTEASVQNSNQNPPKQSMYGKRNWVKWGLIYLVIALLLYGGIYYFVLSKQATKPYSLSYPTPTKSSQPSSTTDPTANWKKYTNTKYGYSVKYPSNWFLFPDGKDAVGGENTTALADFNIPNPDNLKEVQSKGIRINITVDKLITSLNEYINKNVPAKKISTEDIVIDNVKGVKVVYSGLGTVTAVFLSPNGSVYNIATSYGEKEPAIFSQILSTFKFIDQNQATNTSSWKTQTIDLYKLQLLFPPNWTFQEVNRRPEPTGSLAAPQKGHDCADYLISSNDLLAKLSLKPICGYSDGAGEPWPPDAVVVKTLESGNSIIRIFDKTSGSYIYGQGGQAQISDNKGTRKENYYGRIISFQQGNSALFIEVELKYTGPESTKNQYLQDADKIIASLKSL